MAHIKEEMLVVKVSTLVKDLNDEVSVFDSDTVEALESAIGDMIGKGHVVEVFKD